MVREEERQAGRRGMDDRTLLQLQLLLLMVVVTHRLQDRETATSFERTKTVCFEQVGWFGSIVFGKGMDEPARGDRKRMRDGRAAVQCVFWVEKWSKGGMCCA